MSDIPRDPVCGMIVLLQDSDFLEGRLPKKSMLRLTKIFTIHSALILKKIASLKPTKTDQVLSQMRRLSY